MPRVYRTKNERERFLIREFVKHLGYRISSPKWQDRPDALLTLSKGHEKKRIAIEHTDHYHDTVAGRVSPLTPIGDFWKLVNASLVRRISHRKHLTGILGTVMFKANPPIGAGKKTARQQLSRQLAREIIEFAEVHFAVEQSGGHIFRRRDFTSHPTMRALLESIRLARVTDEHIAAAASSWTCTNLTTGHIAASLDYIKSAVAQKNNKAATYENWGKADEKWLLIVAGGGDVNTHAPRYRRDMKWSDPVIEKLCRESPFSKVVVWERVRRWHKWLKS